MRVGMATDHGGFALKAELVARIRGAGHLGLDNLCWVYDSNHITIEGSTKVAFAEDIAARFLGYGWNVLRVGDANDVERIVQAFATFRGSKGRPTFVILDSHIGYGSPHKQDTAEAHGEPLGDNPEVILIASGSEVSLAVQAHEKLVADGIKSRVVSMPTWDISERQPQAYRESVLPPSVTARVAIEQASTFGWERDVGTAGRIIGMKTFGASAPLKELQKKFGFEPDQIVAAAGQLVGKK